MASFPVGGGGRPGTGRRGRVGLAAPQGRAGLAYLKELTELRVLWPPEQITDAGVRALEEALPRLKVSR